MKNLLVLTAICLATAARAYNFGAPVYQNGPGNVTTLTAVSSVTASSFWGNGSHITNLSTGAYSLPSALPITTTISTANVSPGFNGASQFLQATDVGMYPALNGSLIRGIPSTGSIVGVYLPINSNAASASMVPASGVQSGWLGTAVKGSTVNIDGIWPKEQIPPVLYNMTLGGTTQVSTITFTSSGSNGPAVYSEQSLDAGNGVDEHYGILTGTSTGVWQYALGQSLAASTQPWTMVGGWVPCNPKTNPECSALGPQAGGGIYQSITNIDDGDGSISEFNAVVSTPGGYSHRLFGAANNDFSEQNFLDFNSNDGISLRSSESGLFNIDPLGNVEAASITSDADGNIGGNATIDGTATIGQFVWAKNGLQVDTGAVIDKLTVTGTIQTSSLSVNNLTSLHPLNVYGLAVFMGHIVSIGNGFEAESFNGVTDGALNINYFGSGNAGVQISTGASLLPPPIVWKCSDKDRGSASGCAQILDASSMTLTNLPASGYGGSRLLWADNSGIVYATNTVTALTIGDPQTNSAVVDMVYKCTGSTSALMDGAIAAGNSNAALCAGGTWLPTALQLVTVPEE